MDNQHQLPPTLNRNQRRMAMYNSRKAGNNWADQIEVDERLQQAVENNAKAQRNMVNYGRRKASGKPKQSKIISGTPVDSETRQPPGKGELKGKTHTPLTDEPLWNDGPYGGTIPVQQIYSRNPDFSALPIVTDVCYRQMEKANSRLARELPKCMFEHAATEIVNAYMMDHAKHENADPEYLGTESAISILPKEMFMPELFYDYLKTYAPSVTPSSENVRLNYPAAARPQGATDQYEAGHFGPVTAETHNAYECYPSPYVSVKMIERTINVNTRANANEINDPWEPLPAGLRPQDGIATPNLIGYRAPIKVGHEGMARLQNLQFESDNTVAGKIRDCPDLMITVSQVCGNLSSKIKMGSEIPKPSSSQSIHGFVCLEGNVASTQHLATYNAELRSPFTMGAAAVNKSALFALQRQRTDRAPGSCYITEAGNEIAGWEATINSNFNMAGTFAPRTGINSARLREALHIAPAPAGQRMTALNDVFNNSFTVR